MWAGIVTLQVGEWLVGVQYDDDHAKSAIEDACRRWLVDGRDIEVAAFGVRTARVGFRRRRVGLVHHGAPIRWRRESVGRAAETVADVLRDLERPDVPGEVRVEARCFIRGDLAVLADVTPSLVVDETRLARSGIEEVPCWRPMVDPGSHRVRVGDRSWELAGVALGGRPPIGIDDLHRAAWALGSEQTLSWAWQVDALGDRVRATNDPIEPTLDDLLG